MTLTLDVSQYDLSTFDPACLKAAGVTDIIFGVFDPADPPNRMRQAAQSWRDAGGNVLGFYGFCYFGSPFGAYRDTKWAIQLAQEFGVEHVWVDCEADGKGIGFTDAIDPTPATRVAEIQACVDLIRAAGLTPGIYTGGWWWPSGTDNSDVFAALPLWHSAYWDDHREVREVAYGGWTKVAIHQYTSTLSICGRNRDANYVFEEDDMDEEKVRAIVREELAGRPDDDVDDRLREVSIQREQIRHLASDPDAVVVARAFTALKEEGLV